MGQNVCFLVLREEKERKWGFLGEIEFKQEKKMGERKNSDFGRFQAFSTDQILV